MKFYWQAVLSTSLTILTLKARGVLLSLPIFCGREHFRETLTRFSGHKQLLVLILKMFKLVCSCPKHFDLKYCEKCALPPHITFLV